MTIAVVFALAAEWAPWRSRHTFQRVAAGEHPVFEGSVAGSRARVVLSGVGAPHADGLIDAVCASRVDACLSVGLAGALRPQHAAGDLIVARRAESAASGSFVRSDDGLVEVASQCGARILDVLLCVDRVVGHVDEKRRLADRGSAVDMESFRILEAAARRGIPSVAIRVIGDSADEALPLDFNRAIRADGSVNLMNLAGQAVRVPSRWPALVSFGYRQRRAVGELARFLDRFVATGGTSAE